MFRWARMFLLMGLLCLGIAFLPMLLQLTVFPAISPIFAALAVYSVGPLGLLSLLIAAILFLILLVRR